MPPRILNTFAFKGTKRGAASSPSSPEKKQKPNLLLASPSKAERRPLNSITVRYLTLLILQDLCSDLYLLCICFLHVSFPGRELCGDGRGDSHHSEVSSLLGADGRMETRSPEPGIIQEAHDYGAAWRQRWTSFLLCPSLSLLWCWCTCLSPDIWFVSRTTSVADDVPYKVRPGDRQSHRIQKGVSSINLL